MSGGKKVTMGSRPGAPAPTPTPALDPAAEAWIEQGTKATGEAPAEPTKPPEPEKPTEPDKRMTFDVPAALHRRVKMGCAARGVAIREVILQLLEQEFPANQEAPNG